MKKTQLTLKVRLPQGVTVAQARAAIRKQYGQTPAKALENLIRDALPAT